MTSWPVVAAAPALPAGPLPATPRVSPALSAVVDTNLPLVPPPPPPRSPLPPLYSALALPLPLPPPSRLSRPLAEPIATVTPTPPLAPARGGTATGDTTSSPLRVACSRANASAWRTGDTTVACTADAGLPTPLPRASFVSMDCTMVWTRDCTLPYAAPVGDRDRDADRSPLGRWLVAGACRCWCCCWCRARCSCCSCCTCRSRWSRVSGGDGCRCRADDRCCCCRRPGSAAGAEASTRPCSCRCVGCFWEPTGC